MGLIACIFVFYTLNRWDILDVSYFLVAEVTAALMGGPYRGSAASEPGRLVDPRPRDLLHRRGVHPAVRALRACNRTRFAAPSEVMASPPYWAWYPGIILVFSLLPLYFPLKPFRPSSGTRPTSASLATIWWGWWGRRCSLPTWVCGSENRGTGVMVLGAIDGWLLLRRIDRGQQGRTSRRGRQCP
jgi:hypothetical protein